MAEYCQHWIWSKCNIHTLGKRGSHHTCQQWYFRNHPHWSSNCSEEAENSYSTRFFSFFSASWVTCPRSRRPPPRTAWSYLQYFRQEWQMVGIWQVEFILYHFTSSTKFNLIWPCIWFSKFLHLSSGKGSINVVLLLKEERKNHPGDVGTWQGIPASSLSCMKNRLGVDDTGTIRFHWDHAPDEEETFEEPVERHLV